MFLWVQSTQAGEARGVRQHFYIEYPKSSKSTTAIEYTQEVVLRVKCEFIIFPGMSVLYVQTNKWPLRPGMMIMCPCATPLGTFRRGTL